MEDGNIAHNAVGQDQLKDASVSNLQIETDAVQTHHIAPRQVDSSRLAPNAVIRPNIADDAIDPDNLNADQPAQKTSFRARIAAAEQGHDHSGSGEAIADDSITPAMLEADSPAQKQAMRTRIDAAQTGHDHDADIADWAETGNTDNIPASKIPALPGDRITANSMPGDRIQGASITGSQLADGSVDDAQLTTSVETQLVPGGGGQPARCWRNAPGPTMTFSGANPAAGGEDAATWAEQGNTDKIPRSKLPAAAYTQYTKEHTFTITVASLGQANEGRGFDRVSGGGGSASGNGVFTLDGQTLTLVAANQLATGLISIYIHGTLPANFQDRYWIIEDSSGFHDLLRMRDATRYAREPGDTSYPAGLQSFQEITWADQATNVMYTRAVGSTFSLSLAVDPEEYIADRQIGTSNIEDQAVTERKIAQNNITTDLLADDAVTTPKIHDDAVTEAKLANDIVARLNPMGGAGGQSDPSSTVQFVSLWKWSGTAPSTLELTGANEPTWGNSGWTNLPTGWTAPAAVSGVGNRYRADFVATWNSTTNSFDLSTPTITEETGFNVEYTDNPDASPLSTTSNRTSTSTHWRQRDPNTGHWPVIWNALYSGPENWTVLASVPIGVASKTEAKIVTFTNPIRTRDIRLLAVQVDIRNPGLNQTDISASYITQPWNQLWPVAASDASNNYVSGASFVVICGSAEIEVISSQASLPTGVSNAASNYFGTKFKFRGNTATGLLQSVRFFEWAATNQSGYITFLYR